MDIYQIINLGHEYAKLGGAVQEQLDRVTLGDIDNCNPNAVKWMIAFVKAAQKQGAEDCEELLEEMEAFVNWGEE